MIRAIGPVTIEPLSGRKSFDRYYRTWIDLDNDHKWDPTEPYNILGIKRGNLEPLSILLILTFTLIIISLIAYKIRGID